MRFVVRPLDDDAAGLGVNAAPATSLSGPLWGRAGANAAAAGLGVNVAPVTSLSGPLWGRAGANAAAAGLGVNVAPARGWSGPQRCGAARLRAQGWRCLAARLFACAAARAAKVGPITAK